MMTTLHGSTYLHLVDLMAFLQEGSMALHEETLQLLFRGDSQCSTIGSHHIHFHGDAQSSFRRGSRSSYVGGSQA
ncbi:hypothetical protein D8674_010583 [Pyrus ussuriensis x Pyrus communis]|uniref:Uncharacterized protein n=1 Tax=Pyrus ussuriensis x Pyrus communis TaxID=2448454 RepID=A0A5N5FGE4_9ROSA|nr:hypothetical protein D8674_010583 [Pyrus ussuriensis x Pyrus communis]